MLSVYLGTDWPSKMLDLASMTCYSVAAFCKQLPETAGRLFPY